MTWSYGFGTLTVDEQFVWKILTRCSVDTCMRWVELLQLPSILRWMCFGTILDLQSDDRIVTTLVYMAVVTHTRFTHRGVIKHNRKLFSVGSKQKYVISVLNLVVVGFYDDIQGEYTFSIRFTRQNLRYDLMTLQLVAVYLWGCDLGFHIDWHNSASIATWTLVKALYPSYVNTRLI